MSRGWSATGAKVALAFAAPIATAWVVVGAVSAAGCVRSSVSEANASVSRPLARTSAQASFRIKRDRQGRGGGPWLTSAEWRPVAAKSMDALRAEDRPLPNNGLCPPDMATIDDLFCVDRFEASLVEILPNGEERPFSPFEPIAGHVVRAISEGGVRPQAHVSAVQASEACARSGKRLCKPVEWRKACRGPGSQRYGYAQQAEPHRCNDYGRSPVVAMFGAQLSSTDRSGWNWEHMNHPLLNQLTTTLASTGAHEGCTNDYGVYDMVGNLHEWVDDPDGTFLGGYYQDTNQNGEGCEYKTKAHDARYFDYSTGFRCCSDVAP